MQIPIRNLYHIFCYGLSDFYKGDSRGVSGTPSDHPIDLLSAILVREADKLVKRGLHQSYREANSEDASIKGKIDFARSIAGGAITRRRLVYTHDDLSWDPLLNGIIRSTLTSIARSSAVSNPLRHAAGRIASRFPSQDSFPPNAGLPHIRIERHFKDYALAIGVCRLIRESVLVDKDGTIDFVDITRDEVAMRSVFERFVRNLLRHKMDRETSVRSRRYHFRSFSASAKAAQYVPQMITDIVIETESAIAICEVKYVPGSTVVHRGRDRLRSDHLYQLCSYLRNFPDISKPVAGTLLYPTVGTPLSVEFMTDGLPVASNELNLDADWPDVEAQLLAIASATVGRAQSPRLVEVQ